MQRRQSTQMHRSHDSDYSVDLFKKFCRTAMYIASCKAMEYDVNMSKEDFEQNLEDFRGLLRSTRKESSVAMSKACSRPMKDQYARYSRSHSGLDKHCLRLEVFYIFMFHARSCQVVCAPSLHHTSYQHMRVLLELKEMLLLISEVVDEGGRGSGKGEARQFLE